MREHLTVSLEGERPCEPRPPAQTRRFGLRGRSPSQVALIIALLLPMSLDAVTATIKKILPHFMDHEGRHTLSPSLFERDAYQALLRQQPQLRSGLSFDVQWKGPKNTELILQIELRGNREGKATEDILHQTLRRRGWFSNWSSVALTGNDYQRFGELVAWRTTIWSGTNLLARQQSFLW